MIFTDFVFIVYCLNVMYSIFVCKCILSYSLSCVTVQHITDPHNDEQTMDVALNNPLSQEEDVSCTSCINK